MNSRGISRHGFALNVNPDMYYWEGIVPCGLDGVAMVSMRQVLGSVVAMDQVIAAVQKSFGTVFEYELQYEQVS